MKYLLIYDTVKNMDVSNLGALLEQLKTLHFVTISCMVDQKKSRDWSKTTLSDITMVIDVLRYVSVERWVYSCCKLYYISLIEYHSPSS